MVRYEVFDSIHRRNIWIGGLTDLGGYYANDDDAIEGISKAAIKRYSEDKNADTIICTIYCMDSTTRRKVAEFAARGSLDSPIGVTCPQPQFVIPIPKHISDFLKSKSQEKCGRKFKR